MEEQTPLTEPAAPIAEDKLTAIIAYLTIIGFIIAIVLHFNKKTDLGAFHLRQMMGLVLGSLICSFIPVVNIVAWLFFFVLWIFGLIAAIQGEKKPVPLLGIYFERWFATLFV